MLLLLWLAAAWLPATQDLTTGQIIADVRCARDPAEGYALFLPREYTSSREWPVIFAFDPGARGRTPVERYQAAAQRYGFIVAGSNNSRNGSAELGRAVNAMSVDVQERFRIDPKRIYLAGMSGGARVALGIALDSPRSVAGVIASSAGYPDSKPRKTLPFPVFATSGTEDFNHLEMRRLDAALTTPHHLAIFEGGHVWLSSELAMEAVEWMELQAMRSGRKPRDEGEIDRLFATRMAAIGRTTVAKDKFLALQGVVAAFEGLKDVAPWSAQAADLGKDKAVRAGLKADRDDDNKEEDLLIAIRTTEARLTSDDERAAALMLLRTQWKKLSESVKTPLDSAERRLARRVLTGLSAGPPTTDPEYLKIIAEFRMGRGARRP